MTEEEQRLLLRVTELEKILDEPSRLCPLQFSKCRVILDRTPVQLPFERNPS